MIQATIDSTREVLLRQGWEEVQHFCSKNNLSTPSLRLNDPYIPKLHCCAYYRPSYVAIDIARCSRPTQDNWRSWSFPGYKADRTPAGVVCHELGHHLWYVLKLRNSLKEWKEAIKETRAVSGYEPNIEESFAETTRLFVLNPDFLRKGWAYRYWFLRERLQPVHQEDWFTVLQNAPSKVLKATKNLLHI